MLLRLLRRNVAVERSIVLRNRHWSNSHYGANALVVQPTCIRFVSTPSTQKTVSQSDSDLPPSQGRKQKLDLKPAPIKASPSSSSSSHSSPTPVQPTLSTQHSKHKQSTASLSQAKAIAGPPPGASALQLAKYDIALATAQGVLKPPPKDASTFKRLTHQAIELFKFYFRGLKAINTHRKQTAAIRARVQSGGSAISRSEARFIRTYQQDALKLVPFTFLLLTLEELIPLVALYAPRMLPSTCSLPAQHDRIRAAARDRQWIAFTKTGGDGGIIFARAIQTDKATNSQTVSLKQNDVAKAMCGLLDLSAWGPTGFLGWRLRRRLKYISTDDALLSKEGCGKELTLPELNEALYERAIPPQGLSRADMEARLKWWLTFCEGEGTTTDAVSRRLLAVALVGARRS